MIDVMNAPKLTSGSERFGCSCFSCQIVMKNGNAATITPRMNRTTPR